MVKKMTTSELMNELRNQGIDPEDMAGYYRQCSCCGAHVSVDEQSGECVIKGELYEDICDDCIEKAENGAPFEVFEDEIEEEEYEHAV